MELAVLQRPTVQVSERILYLLIGKAFDAHELSISTLRHEVMPQEADRSLIGIELGRRHDSTALPAANRYAFNGWCAPRRTSLMVQSTAA